MTNHNKIPKFKTVQEEAEFWDAHDFTDFMHELKHVTVKVSPNLSHVLPVRFDDETLNGLEVEANRKGLATGTLIRMWVKERLHMGNGGVIKAA